MVGGKTDPASLKVEERPMPICPRCGWEAFEIATKFGPRSSCCGLWSWNRKPLADASTHAIRKQLAPLMDQVNRTLGTALMLKEIRGRTGIADPNRLSIGDMNEATARKVLAAVEDMVIDIMSGELTRRK